MTLPTDREIEEAKGMLGLFLGDLDKPDKSLSWTGSPKPLRKGELAADLRLLLSQLSSVEGELAAEKGAEAGERGQVREISE